MLHAAAAAVAAPHAGPAAGSMARGAPGQPLTLLPGQWSVVRAERGASQMRTLLGSCVGITLWSARHRVGAMCHFLLPSRPDRPVKAADGRYADEALEMIVAALERMGLGPAGFEAQLYGGADTLPQGLGVRLNIGERNIEAGWALVERYGFELQAVDVGDRIPRTISLTLADGRVDVRRGASHT